MERVRRLKLKVMSNNDDSTVNAAEFPLGGSFIIDRDAFFHFSEHGTINMFTDKGQDINPH